MQIYIPMECSLPARLVVFYSHLLFDEELVHVLQQNRIKLLTSSRQIPRPQSGRGGVHLITECIKKRRYA